MSAAPPLIPAALLEGIEVPERERWAEYSRRKTAWLADNPGAAPWEAQDFAARLAEELGL